MDCRFHMAHIEVTDRRGCPVRVPWTDVHVDGGTLSVSRAQRRENPGLPWSLCVGWRAAGLAKRLRCRAAWAVMDEELKCPAAWWIGVLMGLPALAYPVLMAAVVWLGVKPALAGSDEITDLLPAEVKQVELLVVALLLLVGVLMGAAPVFMLGPHLVFRLRNRELAGLRATPRALVLRRRDGSEEVLAWTELVSFDIGGRVRFGGRADREVRVFVFVNPAWGRVTGRLWWTHREAYVGPSLVQMGRGVLVALGVSAIGAELLLWVALPRLGAEEVSYGMMLLSAGGLAAMLVCSLLWERYARRAETRRGGRVGRRG